MKKLIAILTVLCLMLCVFTGCGESKVEYYEEEPATEQAEESTATDAAEAETEAETETETEAEPETEAEAAEEITFIGQGGTGYETYPGDMVVASVNGTDVTWMEYYNWLNYYTMYAVQFAAQYGVALSEWDANDLSSTDTNAAVVIANAQTLLIQDHVIETKAAELGITLSEEDEALIQQDFEQYADSVVGDGDGTATEEEIAAFDEYLEQELFVDRDYFNQTNAIGILSEKLFAAEYGEGGADYSDEDTVVFAEDNGLMAAKHILLLTVDPSTLEALPEEEVAEKLVTAQELSEQLQAVADDQEAMEALFDELTAQYTEDTGYAHYPDGYVFSEGEMVTAFEDAVKSMEVGGLSDVVESEYGYHIILRIPIDPDSVIGTDSAGNEVTLRYAAATQQFSAELTAWVEAAEVVWSEGFETPDMASIFG